MLATLRIQNIAIVESLEVDFGPGMTVITGETGSGKSILVRALKLVLGARASPELVRTGAESACVEALFEIGDDPRAKARLRELDLPVDDELLIRRVIGPRRSRATVNGHLTSATQLRALAGGLVDISSQHEHHSLVDPKNHLDTLDAWANAPDLLERVAEAYRTAIQSKKQLSELRAKMSERSERMEMARFQLGEITRLDPKPGELQSLHAAIQRGQHGQVLHAAVTSAEEVLYLRERALCTELVALEERLQEAAQHDAALRPLATQIAGARTELEDAAEQLGRYARQLDTNPAELPALEDRWHDLKGLVRRFGGDIESTLAKREELQHELAVLDEADHHLEQLEDAARSALETAWSAAEELSALRRRAATDLGRQISSELSDLGMGGARVTVDVAPLPKGDTGVTHRDARLTPRGVDRAEILIAANPGEEPRPLHRIASGGELSRALLATKRVLAGLGPVGTYVFDEVDSGVGGAVADAVGHKLQEVSQHHQVFCITHQPQIAALGTTHLRVEKQVEDGRTHSRLTRLTGERRIEELARMLGGRTITDAARHAARALVTAC
ncbi:MAG: DNA repair protein RecN [Myxococcales bacterium]|nr:DNA repair protein RecN [Myxococcales bacterium]